MAPEIDELEAEAARLEKNGYPRCAALNREIARSLRFWHDLANAPVPRFGKARQAGNDRRVNNLSN